MTGGAFGSHDRAVLPPHQRRTQDAAGGGRGGRHVGDLRHAGRGRAAGGGVAAVRMEAAQPDPGGAGQRHRRRRAALHPRPGPAVPGPAASRLHRTAGPRWAACSPACWPARSRPLAHASASTRAEDALRATCRSTGCGGRPSAAWPSASAV